MCGKAVAVQQAGSGQKRLRVESVQVQKALRLTSVPTTLLRLEGVTPRAAIQLLRDSLPSDMEGKKRWREQARAAAIMGSCPRSHASFLSGVRHWISFIETVHGDADEAFPPSLDSVLEWSNTFRCVGTFCNYLGFLRGACCAISVAPPPVGHPALKRAMCSIAKRQLFTGRPKMFIQRFMLRNIMTAEIKKGAMGLRHAMLWLVAYTFLLRVPSEVSLRVLVCLLRGTMHLAGTWDVRGGCR